MSEMDERLPLGRLDPGSRDPGFWVRFHAQVMDRARAELARRRLAVEPTVADMVCAWRRTLIPLTLLAAALAAILLTMSGKEQQTTLPPLALEDMLLESVSGDPLPAVLSGGPELEEVAFLTGLERF